MKDKIYNASRGEKIDLLALAQMINESADFKSDIITVNGGLNNEYTSNADKIISEMGGFEFTSHADAIIKMRNYFRQNLDKLDVEVIKTDPYLKGIDTIWKKDGDIQ
jgi:GDP-L-fucose synthase